MRFSFQWPWRGRPSEWEEWYALQLRAYQEGAEAHPPWVTFPEIKPWSPVAEPWPSRQGIYKAWLRDVYLPFWRQQRDTERDAYLKRWPPPPDAWQDYLEKMGRSRNIVAVEDQMLCEALLRGIQEQQLRADFLQVEQLRETELYGSTFIVLNTGQDLDRLFATAKRLYETWVVPGYGSLWIRTYSPRAASSDRVVSRLWSAGDPDAISPGVYDPSNPGEVVREVTMYLARIEGRR